MNHRHKHTKQTNKQTKNNTPINTTRNPPIGTKDLELDSFYFRKIHKGLTAKGWGFFFYLKPADKGGFDQ
jgi:hypothetical protein